MRLNGSRFGSNLPNLPDVPLPVVPPCGRATRGFSAKNGWHASGGERFLDDSADLLLSFPVKRLFHAMAPEARVQDTHADQGRRTIPPLCSGQVCSLRPSSPHHPSGTAPCPNS